MSVSHKSYHQPERSGGAAINRTYGTQADCPHPKKIAYASGRDAKKALKMVKHRDLTRSARLHTYLCVCGAHHVGTFPAWATDRQGLRVLGERKRAA